MKLCLPALLLAMSTTVTLADNPPTPLELRQVASCKAWVRQLDQTIDLMRHTGAISHDDASATNAVVRLLGSRCESAEARRISDLLVVTLDVLTDAPNQP
jgi:hypothetical protein